MKLNLKEIYFMAHELLFTCRIVCRYVEYYDLTRALQNSFLFKNEFLGSRTINFIVEKNKEEAGCVVHSQRYISQKYEY